MQPKPSQRRSREGMVLGLKKKQTKKTAPAVVKESSREQCYLTHREERTVHAGMVQHLY